MLFLGHLLFVCSHVTLHGKTVKGQYFQQMLSSHEIAGVISRTKEVLFGFPGSACDKRLQHTAHLKSFQKMSLVFLSSGHPRMDQGLVDRKHEPGCRKIVTIV